MSSVSQAVGEIFQRGSKYFEIFGPGGPYISGVQIFRDSPIMAYGSMPYVGMTPKKMAAILKVHTGK